MNNDDVLEKDNNEISAKIKNFYFVWGTFSLIINLLTIYSFFFWFGINDELKNSLYSIDGILEICLCIDFVMRLLLTKFKIKAAKFLIKFKFDNRKSIIYFIYSLITSFPIWIILNFGGIGNLSAYFFSIKYIKNSRCKDIF